MEKKLPKSEKARRIHFELENISFRRAIEDCISSVKLRDKILDRVDALMARKRGARS